MSLRIHVLTSLSVSVLLAIDASAQVTRADYERAMGLRDKYQYLTVNVPSRRRGSRRRAGSTTESR
jgi:hypothetical protein